MIEILKSIAGKKSLQSGLYDFFGRFDTKDKAYYYFKTNFEPFDDDTKKTLRTVFDLRF